MDPTCPNTTPSGSKLAWNLVGNLLWRPTPPEIVADEVRHPDDGLLVALRWNRNLPLLSLNNSNLPAVPLSSQKLTRTGSTLPSPWSLRRAI
jgi:hypothetical protein